MDRGPYKKWTSEVLFEAKALYSRGLSFADIGAALDRTPKSIERRLARGVYKDWTRQELAEARRMRAEGKVSAEIGMALGRTTKSVESRLKRPDVSGPRHPRIVGHAEGPFDIPPTVWEDRDRRLLTAPRNLTAAVMGDPIPGFSALEKR